MSNSDLNLNFKTDKHSKIASWRSSFTFVVCDRCASKISSPTTKNLQKRNVKRSKSHQIEILRSVWTCQPFKQFYGERQISDHLTTNEFKWGRSWSIYQRQSCESLSWTPKSHKSYWRMYGDIKNRGIDQPNCDLLLQGKMWLWRSWNPSRCLTMTNPKFPMNLPPRTKSPIDFVYDNLKKLPNI